MKRTVVHVIAQAVASMQHAEKVGRTDWYERHLDDLQQVVEEYMPHGGGFDAGTKIVIDKSTNGSRLLFRADFHHMDEHDVYDGWTEHFVTVKPDFLSGVAVFVSGRDRNDIKEYIRETFYTALTREIEFVSKHQQQLAAKIKAQEAALDAQHSA